LLNLVLDDIETSFGRCFETYFEWSLDDLVRTAFELGLNGVEMSSKLVWNLFQVYFSVVLDGVKTQWERCFKTVQTTSERRIYGVWKAYERRLNGVWTLFGFRLNFFRTCSGRRLNGVWTLFEFWFEFWMKLVLDDIETAFGRCFETYFEWSLDDLVRTAFELGLNGVEMSSKLVWNLFQVYFSVVLNGVWTA
jgi:hypothetical protein